MKTRLIVNPSSGRSRRNRRLVATVRAFLAEQRLDADFAVTEGPGHATELARAALVAGCERVVAVGGDGTVNDAAQALVGTSAVLALVPCGSGNGLARHLGLPLQPRRALALLADPTARIVAIDTGTANGHPFFNVMGAGFDANISQRFNHLPQRGLPAYLRAGFREFLRHRPEPVTIEDADRHVERLEAFIVAVANSDQYGNSARLAPGACVNDGLLDLVAVLRPGILRAMALVARLFLGGFDRSPRVRRLRSARFVIRRPAPGLIHTDGETHATGATIEVAVRPLSLRLLVPAACRVGASAGPAASPLPPWTRNASGSAP
ncbi:MAG TPA: YegS/Rv2252/BmrU family lipid kinase [Opitutaceae bacterium]|nr:YegS/Rv2252/BmrU family lipid kinase [Opitutaceae bacterium]